MQTADCQGPCLFWFGRVAAILPFSLEHLKKPISELLMHTGETYRRIQEERELIDCTLPTRRDRKVRPPVLSARGAGGGTEEGDGGQVSGHRDAGFRWHSWGEKNLSIAKHH